MATQSSWITTAVPLLVVIADNVFDRIRKVNALQNVAADGWMDLHFGEFGFRKLARLVEDVFRDRQLADVMQQCAREQRA